MGDGAKRVRVYVDGFNLYYGGLDHADVHRRETFMSPSWKWMDVAKATTNALKRRWPDVSVTHVYYFTAPVRPRWNGDTSRNRQDVYLRALEATGIEVVRGAFRIDAKEKYLLDVGTISAKTGRPNKLALLADRSQAWVQIVEEKGSDVNLASRLLIDYFDDRESFDRAVVVSNDSDLAAPIGYLWSAGWATGVLNPHPGHPALSRPGLTAPHFVDRLTFEDMLASQLPAEMNDAEGRELRKPPSW